MGETIHISTSFNDKYYRYAYIMILSVLENQDHVDTIHFHLLHNDVSKEHRDCIGRLIESYQQSVEWIHIDKSDFPEECRTNDTWSIEAYFRLMLPDLLSENVNRLIYLDVDIIVNKPLGEFYRLDMEGNCICACEDASELPFQDRRDEVFAEFGLPLHYICSGVMLIDMELLGKTCHFKDYMELARRFDFNLVAPDQDLINYMHHDQIKIVPNDLYDLFAKYFYNMGWHYDDVKRYSAIIHFAGQKPWAGQYVHYDIEKLWWDYAKLSPFYVELLEEFMISSVNSSLIYDSMVEAVEEKARPLGELQKSAVLCKKLYEMLPK